MLTESNIKELGTLAMVWGLSAGEAKFLPAFVGRLSYHTQGDIDRAMLLLSTRTDIQDYCKKVVRQCLQSELVN